MTHVVTDIRRPSFVEHKNPFDRVHRTWRCSSGGGGQCTITAAVLHVTAKQTLLITDNVDLEQRSIQLRNETTE